MREVYIIELGEKQWCASVSCDLISLQYVAEYNFQQLKYSFVPKISASFCNDWIPFQQILTKFEKILEKGLILFNFSTMEGKKQRRKKKT